MTPFLDLVAWLRAQLVALEDHENARGVSGPSRGARKALTDTLAEAERLSAAAVALEPEPHDLDGESFRAWLAAGTERLVAELRRRLEPQPGGPWTLEDEPPAP